MAIDVYTTRPKSLLRAIKTAIANRRVKTWDCDNDGDFTHSADQWNRQAWLRPTIDPGRRLTLNIFGPKGTPISRLVYGIYHGRFIEMLLVHFDEQCDRVAATALPTSGDHVLASD